MSYSSGTLVVFTAVSLTTLIPSALACFTTGDKLCFTLQFVNGCYKKPLL